MLHLFVGESGLVSPKASVWRADFGETFYFLSQVFVFQGLGGRVRLGESLVTPG